MAVIYHSNSFHLLQIQAVHGIVASGGIPVIENRLLNYFLTVAREKNMTKAAAQLHIAQPTLSKQIAELEEQLGLKLFKRTNKNTILTEDGMQFRVRAQEIIDLMNKVEAEFQTAPGSVSGDIFLGCGETHIMSYISSLFKNIQQAYPDIHFHIYSGDAEAVLERLDKGLLDVGLLLGPIFHDKYDYLSLGMYDYFGLLVPADCELAKKESISASELKELPILIPNQIAAGAHDLGDFDVSELHAVGSYNLVTNATYMVDQGLGYAFTLANLVNTDGRNLKLLPIDPEIKIEALIVTKKYASFSKPVRLFLDQLNMHRADR